MADSEKKNVQAEGVSENGEMSEELQKKLKELDKESNTAEIQKASVPKVIAVICICFSLFQIYTGFFGALDAMIQRCVHLSFGICLVYLLCPTKKAWVKEGRFHPIDVALAVLAMIPPIYILVNYQQLILRAGTVTPTDTVIGVLGIVMIIEAARRIVGLPIVIVVCCFLAYGFFGPYLPGRSHIVGSPSSRWSDTSSSRQRVSLASRWVFPPPSFSSSSFSARIWKRRVLGNSSSISPMPSLAGHLADRLRSLSFPRLCRVRSPVPR